MSKYTRDKWRQVDHGNAIHICAGDSNGTRVICKIQTCWDDEGNEEQRDNAKLIVAAPDLLNALIDLLRDEKLDDGDPALEKSRGRAHRAIRIATGGAP